MRKNKTTTTEVKKTRSEEIADEVGMDTLENLKALHSALVKALVKRAKERAKAQLQKADE